MTRRFVDGGALMRAAEYSVANLERHVEEVNALNVFPVPDRDTGSNMLATMRAAIAEARGVPPRERTLERVAAALSAGSTMGARGNSGVILSQIVRGMAEVAQGRRRATGVDLARALLRGSELAAAAVVRPVEGTILTVIRESAHAATGAAEHIPGVEAVLQVVIRAAASAVAATPRLLPVLREAGVVDSGGHGLYLLLEGTLMGVADGPSSGWSTIAAPMPAIDPASLRPGDEPSSAGIPGFETMFLITAAQADLDLPAVRAELGSMADSVLVAGDAREARIHVHNERPDLILRYGLTLGSMSQVTVEPLDPGGSGALEQRANLTAGGSVPGLAMVAVASSASVAEAFTSLGVAVIVGGPGGAQPSTGELVAAILKAAAPAVIVLPNDLGVLPIALEAAARIGGVEVAVVPTRNAAEGLAAALSLDAGAGVDANVQRMAAAARAVQTLRVIDSAGCAEPASAPADARGTLVLDADDRQVAAGHDRIGATLDALRTLARGFELVTIYRGAATELAEATHLGDVLREAFPGVAVELIDGGEANCAYLIAAE